MNLEFHPAAERELLDAIHYYNDQRPDLGYELAEAVEEAVERIRTNPEGWTWISKNDDLRRCQTKRFPYGLIYQVQPGRIVVVAVMHLKRRPGYWKDRLP